MTRNETGLFLCVLCATWFVALISMGVVVGCDKPEDSRATCTEARVLDSSAHVQSASAVQPSEDVDGDADTGLPRACQPARHVPVVLDEGSAY